MKKMKRILLSVLMVFLTGISVFSQVTTSGISGKVTGTNNESLPGVTIIVTHTPSGTTAGVITNAEGRYTLQGLRTGGPYRVDMSFVGFQKAVFNDVYLNLGENYVLDANLKESTEEIGEVIISATAISNMKSDRAGAITSVSREMISATPTITRSMNDIMRLSPQSSTTSNGYAVGGGNYRQSFVTVDGAAFNNAFGIGANLPANGSPISLDALEEISVSITPYDVRQSGFIGGAINAVTRSGGNEFKGTAYTYMNGDQWQGDKVGDYELTKQDTKFNTYGLSVGGPIIKNKLFFFVNAEYEDNVSPGPSFILRKSDTEEFGKNNVFRPTEGDVKTMQDYLQNTYQYSPGQISNYPSETPSMRLMGRLDWNIN